jgi:ERCC4-type nuclease
MNEIDNTFYMDDREKKPTQVIASIIYDDMVIKRLDVGDVLMRGVVFEMKHPEDFVSSVFDKRLFTQITDMTDNYKNAHILVHGTYSETKMVYNSRSRVENFDGIIASCISRGITPLFTGSLDTSLDLIDLISKKCTDGKDRSRPIKRVSLKDKQIGLVCSLPGVSDTRAKALLTHFGSINGILTASEKELCGVPDIGPKTAGKIRRILTKEFK